MEPKDSATSQLLETARKLCISAHAGQLRKYTGKPYHTHPSEVEEILHAAGLSAPVRAAGLLHDVIEDTNLTYDDLHQSVGKEVADLVQMVTDVSKSEDGNRTTRKRLDREHVARASPGGKSVKLADLISNLSTIARYDPDFARGYMREKALTLEVLRGGHPELHRRASAIVTDYWAGVR